MDTIKFKPILFSTPMVQAILEGRKTMTRRVVKVQPRRCDTAVMSRDKGEVKFGFSNNTNTVLMEGDWYKSKFGKAGDILWVRETIRKYYLTDENGYIDFDNIITDYAADNPEPICLQDGNGFKRYKKDGTEKMVPWKPSIFMPKEACRLFLQITDIRVERLQDIDERDAVAEGIERITDGPFSDVKRWGWRFKNYSGYQSVCLPIASFQSLWQKINGNWNDNPWVWVISFKVIDKPSDFNT